MIWTLRRRRPVYPYVTDVFVTRPALIDTTGDPMDLYGTTAWWDGARISRSAGRFSLAGSVWFGGTAPD